MISVSERIKPVTRVPLDPVICDCFQVTEAEIHEAVERTGVETVGQVMEETMAGTGCGGCQCRIKRILSGLPAQCGPCALCPGCGFIRNLCHCRAA